MHLKAAYLEWATQDAARAQMLAHRDHYRERLLQWSNKIAEIDAGSSTMLNKRLSTPPEEDHARTIAFKRFTCQGMVARARQEIEWAEQGLAFIEEVSGPASG